MVTAQRSHLHRRDGGDIRDSRLGSTGRAALPGTPEPIYQNDEANAYIGADLAPAFAINPNKLEEMLAITTPIYLKVLASDPPARMAGLAEEIAKRNPDLVGLEEMWTLNKGPLPAARSRRFTITWSCCRTRLRPKGAHYKVVST